MENDILNLLDVCQLGEWLDMHNMPADVQILIGSQRYPLSEFVKKIKGVIEAEAMQKARNILEDRATDFEDRVQSLVRFVENIAAEVSSEFKREALRILPEAVTGEDCR